MSSAAAPMSALKWLGSAGGRSLDAGGRDRAKVVPGKVRGNTGLTNLASPQHYMSGHLCPDICSSNFKDGQALRGAAFQPRGFS